MDVRAGLEVFNVFPTGYSYLELSEGETTASTNATVVLDGGATDDRAELVDGLRSDLGGLLLAVDAAGGLLARL